MIVHEDLFELVNTEPTSDKPQKSTHLMGKAEMLAIAASLREVRICCRGDLLREQIDAYSPVVGLDTMRVLLS